MEKGLVVVSSVSLKSLVVARRIALRRRIWFKTLSRIERAQVDLTIQVVQKVQSKVLKNVLDGILQKISRIVESQGSCLEKNVGRSIAKKLSLIATSWGHRSAENWPQDEGFVRFLTISRMYAPRAFKE